VIAGDWLDTTPDPSAAGQTPDCYLRMELLAIQREPGGFHLHCLA
jgi:hypothetical protein